MPEKRDRLTEVARQESEAAEVQARQRADRADGEERLGREVPLRFFAFARELREAVERFNRAADPGRRLSWRESPAVAAQSLEPAAERHLSFGRHGADVTVTLTSMSRGTRPEVHLIEATGSVGKERFMVRAEGTIKGSAVTYRVSVDLKRVDCTLEELAERLVLAAVKESARPLYN